MGLQWKAVVRVALIECRSSLRRYFCTQPLKTRVLFRRISRRRLRRLLYSSGITTAARRTCRRPLYWHTSARPPVRSVGHNSSGVHNSGSLAANASRAAARRPVQVGSPRRVVRSWPGPYFFDGSSSYTASLHGPRGRTYMRCQSSVVRDLRPCNPSLPSRKPVLLYRVSRSVNFKPYITN